MKSTPLRERPAWKALELHHALVGDDYWAAIRDLMVQRLRRGEARAALVDAVGELGRSLARHFPRRSDDTNELSDSVSIEP